MLTHLSIQNFAIVDSLDLELQSGMTAITGETGAGKSIMLDALALVLGGRADSNVVPPGKPRAEIAATLDLRAHPIARQWLLEQQLEQSADGDGDQHASCLLRRVITKEGRSHAWINGQPVTLQQLKMLGSQLIDIHSQHEHQSLLQRDSHRLMLDAAAGAQQLAERVRVSAHQWRELDERLQQLRSHSDEQNARLQLLRYQVEELDQLDLSEGELAQLEQEQKQLANADGLLGAGEQILALCRESVDESAPVLDLLDQALHVLGSQKTCTPALQEAEKLLESARIQVEEACHELDVHQASVEVNPERLREVEQRLSHIYQVARKHRLQTDHLVEFHQRLRDEFQALSGAEHDPAALERERDTRFEHYRLLALQLGEKRRQAAEQLSKAINRELKSLNMSGCQFRVEFTAREAVHVHGMEQIEFFVSTNPGQPFLPLKKVASGGELSRISLAIQVVTARTSVIPTLVFDEVDVGIGGETAAVVGQLLRRLGEKGQVICVTHQAAVAAKAHHHWFVTKTIARGKVSSSLLALGMQDRIDEVARMIGGTQSAESRAHAEVMLKAG